MVNLNSLLLSSTGITGDISALSKLIKIVTLRLFVTGITGDISSLSGMTSASVVFLFRPISP